MLRVVDPCTEKLKATSHDPWKHLLLCLWTIRRRIRNVSCRTAPKSGGVDDVETVLVSRDEKDKIAAEMGKIGDERNVERFKRDGNNVRRSEAILLAGVNGRTIFVLSCGASLYSTCEEFFLLQLRSQASTSKGQPVCSKPSIWEWPSARL